MSFIKQLVRQSTRFFARRLMSVLRLVVGIFMILIGAWFVLAPITQQFLLKSEAVGDAPYLWLIVPIGVLQIAIGISLLRTVLK